jgi:RNA polymerase sigma-70 factor (ECF subfamily)
MQPCATEEFGTPKTTSNPEVGSAREFHFGEQPGLDDFADIYTVYGPRVYYLCLRMTGNADDAEDLSQEAFLRLMQKLGTFRGESAFYTWLRRLAINVVLLRFQKASWRRETSLDALMEPKSDFGFAPGNQFATIDPQLLGAIDRINLERAIDQLPPGFKAVFILHDIEGYEHSEISRLLGCSIGTSKSQLHKARMKMRELLAGSSRERPLQYTPKSGSETHERQPVDAAQEQSVSRFPRLTPHEYEASYSRAA